jgi:putative heme-binding domain-containing protein
MRRGGLVILTLAVLTLPGLAQQRQAAPVLPGGPEAVKQGGDIYGQNCTGCHGAEGAAGEIGPAIVSGERADRRSDAQILATVQNGVPGTPMPAFKGKIADGDILKLVAYLHALRGTAIDNPALGDAAHGEAIFWGKGQCGTCHMLNGRGGLTAPDLSNIAGVRRTAAITDALTKPQHHVYGDGGSHIEALAPMDTWLPVHVTDASGRNYDGVLMNQDSFSLQMMGNDQQLHLFEKARLKRLTIDPKSLMPTDYDKRLSAGEFRDLLAFLTRQGKPADAGGGK